MGYFLLAISMLASVVAFRGWLGFITPWIRRRRNATDIAEIGVGDWPGIVGAFLPQRARQVWNALVITVWVLVLGLPHFLVLWTFFKPGEPDPWYYFHFVWTLVYWLALLGLPATFVASHRLSLVSGKDIGCSDSQ